MKSHYEIKLEKYCQVLNIEVNTMRTMVLKNIVPSTYKYINLIADTQSKMSRKGRVKGMLSVFKTGDSKDLMSLMGLMMQALSKLNEIQASANKKADLLERAKTYAQSVLPAMRELRSVADEIEQYLGLEFKPYPSYDDLLFSVQ